MTGLLTLRMIAMTVLLSAAVSFTFAGPTTAPSAPTTAPASPQDVRPLTQGASAPVLKLLTVDGQPFDLNAAIARQPTILIFYRGSWCPYCNAQLGKLQTVEKDLLSLGYQILAVSPDKPAKLSEMIDKQHLTYTLLSDADATAISAFGLAFHLDDVTLNKYRQYGVDLDASSGHSHHLLPVPAVYIVGTDGKIQFVHYNPDYTQRLDPAKLLEVARKNHSSN